MPMTKTLCGVLHDEADKEEIQQVLDLIDNTNPAKVGLEITNKYAETNHCPEFFDRIHDYARTNGRRIVPLEHQLAHEKYSTVNAVVLVLEDKLSRENLEFLLQYTTIELKKRFALKSSQIRALEENQKTTKHALKLLDSNPTKEEAIKWYEEAETEREKHMLNRILRHNPDLVIIGVKHAEAIKDNLQEYQYICLAKRDAEGIFES